MVVKMSGLKNPLLCVNTAAANEIVSQLIPTSIESNLLYRNSIGNASEFLFNHTDCFCGFEDFFQQQLLMIEEKRGSRRENSTSYFVILPCAPTQHGYLREKK